MTSKAREEPLPDLKAVVQAGFNVPQLQRVLKSLAGRSLNPIDPNLENMLGFCGPSYIYNLDIVHIITNAVVFNDSMT